MPHVVELGTQHDFVELHFLYLKCQFFHPDGVEAVAGVGIERVRGGSRARGLKCGVRGFGIGGGFFRSAMQGRREYLFCFFFQLGC